MEELADKQGGGGGRRRGGGNAASGLPAHKSRRTHKCCIHSLLLAWARCIRASANPEAHKLSLSRTLTARTRLGNPAPRVQEIMVQPRPSHLEILERGCVRARSGTVTVPGPAATVQRVAEGLWHSARPFGAALRLLSVWSCARIIDTKSCLASLANHRQAQTSQASVPPQKHSTYRRQRVRRLLILSSLCSVGYLPFSAWSGLTEASRALELTVMEIAGGSTTSSLDHGFASC